MTYFYWKILALAGIQTRDLTSTKPICYQRSYPPRLNLAAKIFRLNFLPFGCMWLALFFVKLMDYGHLKYCNPLFPILRKMVLTNWPPLQFLLNLRGLHRINVEMDKAYGYLRKLNFSSSHSFSNQHWRL